MNSESYQVASIKNDAKLRERLAKFEEEISKEFGEDMVVVVYGKDDDTINSI